MKRGLRYSKHTYGHRLTVKFVFETDWSKNFSKSESLLEGQKTSNFDVLKKASIHVFDEDSFVYLVNNDKAVEAKRHFGTQAQQLPNAPWGLNDYQSIHKVAVLSALNPTPAHLGFLRHLYQEPDQVRDALYHSHVYQAVMRSSLRNLAATAPVVALVPDRSSAQALFGFFAGSRIEKLQWDLKETELRKVGRPAKTKKKSTTQRTSDSRERKKRMENQIERVKRGNPVDQTILKEYERICRSNNATLIELKRVIAAQTNQAQPSSAAD